MDRVDCLILGGGLTGAAAAVLLKRRHPAARVKLIEARTAFPRRGVVAGTRAGLFFTRTLRLWDHLAADELPHHGARFWFHDNDVLTIQSATEFGPRRQPAFPGFLLREDLIGERLLEIALSLGVEVERPATVRHAELQPFDSLVTWTDDAGVDRRTEATWVLDASGREALLARQLGLVRKLEAHPIGSLACRWEGDLDLDGPRFEADTPFARWPLVARRLSSNHFVGYGYEVWLLPLSRSELEVTVLVDRRVVPLPAEADTEDFYTRFLSGLPAVRQLLQNARRVRDDLRVVPQIAWEATRTAGEGWMLLGGAAGMLDDLAGQELDRALFGVEHASWIVAEGLAARPIDRRLNRFDAEARQSADRRLSALVRDRFLVHGDFSLFWPLWSAQVAASHLHAVPPAVRRPDRLLRAPLAGAAGAFWSTALALVRRRFVALARTRMWTGNYGAYNHGRRRAWHPPSGLGAWALLVVALLGWWLREFEHFGLAFARRVAHDRGKRALPDGADLATLPEGIEIHGESTPQDDDGFATRTLRPVAGPSGDAPIVVDGEPPERNPT